MILPEKEITLGVGQFLHVTTTGLMGIPEEETALGDAPSLWAWKVLTCASKTTLATKTLRRKRESVRKTKRCIDKGYNKAIVYGKGGKRERESLVAVPIRRETSNVRE